MSDKIYINTECAINWLIKFQFTEFEIDFIII